jgi:hypothetical protein
MIEREEFMAMRIKDFQIVVDEKKMLQHRVPS